MAQPDRRDCVVDIEAEIAGSPLVRALVDLYLVVDSRRCKVLVSNYPDDYIVSLTEVGITNLPGFRMYRTKKEALSDLSKV